MHDIILKRGNLQ